MTEGSTIFQTCHLKLIHVLKDNRIQKNVSDKYGL